MSVVPLSSRTAAGLLLLLAAALGLVQACSASTRDTFDAPADAGEGVTDGGPAGHEPSFSDPVDGGGAGCFVTCSSDFRALLDCHGDVVERCSDDKGCNSVTGTCTDPCEAAVANKQSVGCEYYATNMDQSSPDACFAAFVANTWSTPARIEVEYEGTKLPVASFTRIPAGSGPSLTYQPFDPTVGIPPGEVAILFLAGSPTHNVKCPAPPAVPSGSQIAGRSGVGSSFRITSDVPVVAYQINPYGGGSAAVTGASLLLPTSVWGTNYVAVTVTPYDAHPPSMNVVATEDDTNVTMLPNHAVVGGGELPAGAANEPYTFKLDKGQQAQFSQRDDLTGSAIQSDKPIGFMAGQPCMRIPTGVSYCDHGEQMIPPVSALGHEYVGAMFRPRIAGDEAIWQLVGVVDGTALTWSSDVGGPATINAGTRAEFTTDQAFTVKSQDADHPFMLFAYMSGSQWKTGMSGYGDPDMVISVPPQQYLSEYVFFADPTYPETNLVIVRAKTEGGAFEDVALDCAGALDGWQPVGDYEWTRVDLVRGDFEQQGSCSTGRRRIESKAPFGLWVWGWGTPQTRSFTSNVSYGYPGGMSVRPINKVVIPPTLPK